MIVVCQHTSFWYLFHRSAGPRPVNVFFFNIHPSQLLSKLWCSQLLKHNNAAVELQFGPSSINKPEWDTLVTAMFYHFLDPWYMRGLFPWKNISKSKVFFLSHTSKLNQQKHWKSAANIILSNKYAFFPVVLLMTNHEALYSLNIVLSFHPPFEPITAHFTITGLWPAMKHSLLTYTKYGM